MMKSSGGEQIGNETRSNMDEAMDIFVWWCHKRKKELWTTRKYLSAPHLAARNVVSIWTEAVLVKGCTLAASDDVGWEIVNAVPANLIQSGFHFTQLPAIFRREVWRPYMSTIGRNQSGCRYGYGDVHRRHIWKKVAVPIRISTKKSVTCTCIDCIMSHVKT